MLCISNFVIKEMKCPTIISNKQIFKKSILDGFYASENKNKRKLILKTNLPRQKKFKNQFYTSHSEYF